MKKRIAVISSAVIALAALLFVVFFIFFGDIKYDISREQRTITGDNGKTIANIYYDRVTLRGNSESVSKINGILEKDYNDWLSSSTSGRMARGGSLAFFLERVEATREIHGDDVLSEYPLEFSVTAQVTYAENNIISIKHEVFWSAGGTMDTTYLCSTFDLKTGTLIPFNEIVDVGSREFMNSCLSYLLTENLYDADPYYLWIPPSEIEDWFSLGDIDNFKLNYSGETVSLNYEYYYDGKNIHLIFRGFSSNIIVKWNGKTGEEFRAEWRY
ncbi:MAG: hypothetical protein LBL82_06340 [Oscillospiraceae bacterium]|jgi:hypothetical protein|nr:hypothetical protein [Oscillospiraceae bacterium]